MELQLSPFEEIPLESEQDLRQVTLALQEWPGFEKSAFEQLVEDTDSLVALKILSRFYIGLEEAQQAIRQGIEDQDAGVIWKACHKVTGSSELLGFKNFGQKSRRLDSDVKAMPDVSLHSKELQEYLQETQALCTAIQKGFPNLRSYL